MRSPLSAREAEVTSGEACTANRRQHTTHRRVHENNKILEWIDCRPYIVTETKVLNKKPDLGEPDFLMRECVELRHHRR